MSIPLSGEHPERIPGPAGVIEAVLTVPEGCTSAAHFAVVCHPHPLHGGAMGNKVVSTLVRLYRDLGLPSIRFNFRGVGASEGVHDHAKGEVDDLEAVLRWARDTLGGQAVSLAGFSFGSYVAAAGSQRLAGLGLKSRGLILVAPPVHHYPFVGLSLPEPTLVVQGDADEVVPAEEVFTWVEGLQPAPVLIRMDSAGHFFHGRLTDLKAELASRL